MYSLSMKRGRGTRVRERMRPLCLRTRYSLWNKSDQRSGQKVTNFFRAFKVRINKRKLTFPMEWDFFMRTMDARMEWTAIEGTKEGARESRVVGIETDWWLKRNEARMKRERTDPVPASRRVKERRAERKRENLDGSSPRSSDFKSLEWMNLKDLPHSPGSFLSESIRWMRKYSRKNRWGAIPPFLPSPSHTDLSFR